MKRAGVIGGGAWGTALAQVCARAGLERLRLGLTDALDAPVRPRWPLDERGGIDP